MVSNTSTQPAFRYGILMAQLEPLVSLAVAHEAEAARLGALVPPEKRKVIRDLEDEMQTLEHAANGILAEASRMVPFNEPREVPAPEGEIRVVA